MKGNTMTVDTLNTEQRDTLTEHMTPELMDKMYRAIRRKCHGDLEADEVMGQTLLRISRGIDTFDPSTGATGFRSWCMTTMYNTWRNVITTRAKAPMLEPIPDSVETDGWTEATTYAELRHFHDTVNVSEQVCDALSVSPYLQGALDSMPVEQAEALVMFSQGHSYQEIAEAQGVPINTVSSRVKRARTKARVMLSVAT